MTSHRTSAAGDTLTVGEKKMEAAVFRGPRMIDISSVAIPTPGPGQVRVRLDGCGVCASNLPVWQGRPYFTYPFEHGAPGHEAWGRVDAVGADVQGLRPGDRVAMLSYHAYAEYDVASAGDIVRLPEDLDGMQRAVEASRQGVFPTRELLTHRYGLDQLALATQDLEQRPDGFLKGWVSYG